MTPRQRFAFDNPVDRSAGRPRQPHPEAREVKGKWSTIVEVSNGPGLGWTWMASISRLRAPGRPYAVGQWKPEWHQEADEILRGLLDGVGGDDIDVPKRMTAAGLDPRGLAAHHLWRPLTDDEEAALGARESEGS